MAICVASMPVNPSFSSSVALRSILGLNSMYSEAEFKYSLIFNSLSVSEILEISYSIAKELII